MRASGILLPVSSLPSKYGIGCFSEEAYEFVDQLARAGQKYWQILPLGPTGYGDSPYQSFSTFAGNPYFIDLEAFVKEGYLDKSDCEDCDWGTNESYVDYEKIYNSRFRLLRKAFENYDCETDQEYRKFVKENAAWLEDYSLYMAIKDSLNGISWIEWPTELKNREKAALAEEREKLAKEVDFLQRLKAYLEEGNLAIGFELQDEDEEAWFAEYNLLTAKPVIYAANVSEDDLADDGASNAYVQAVRDFAAKNGSEVFVICAQIEQEISELDEDERKMFLEDLGLKESGLEKLIKASYSLLGLISYLTAGETETRAWTIKKGTKAPQAAGKIHSDFERGFIRAEVVNYQDLLDCGSYSAAKEKGLVGLEGKDYVVKDGDVVLFRFNV